MVKIVSYRQKLLELAKIYKIDKIFDQDLKLTTYDIEIILLKNNVPLPANSRGYLSHKLINEVYKPFHEAIRKKISIKINLSKTFKNFYEGLNKKIATKINVRKIFINKYLKKLFNIIEEYFKFITFNIFNFFNILGKTIVESLNDIYNFKVKEKIIDNLLSRGGQALLVLILVFSGFYLKGLVTDLDSIKIALEIKTDKKKNNKKSEKNGVIKIPENMNSNSTDVAKLSKNKKSSDAAKLSKDKKISPSDGDYVLNTETVLTLFEDLEYDLDNVRDKKKVKPIYFTRLPKDLINIKNVREKKETFLQILLPLIVAENGKIKKDRKYLFKILKNNETPESKKWLNKKYKSYKVSSKNINELIEKIDIIPTSIALAQAAKESGWGTSRFALEGNAIYGQWTWSGDGIEPLEKTKDQNHKILKFPLLRASVKAYIINLNTHRGYKSFRLKRAELRKQNKKLSGIDLIHELENYAQTGKEYTKILEQIIKQNDLDELEAVTIDDFKDNKQLKL